MHGVERCLSSFFQAFHRIASTFIAELAIVRACGKFFKGISFSSICAGALAAVTSFLLSAKIGIAGSVIGVAAGSVVSAVATQVYKNVLKASGEKLQQAVPLPSSSDEASDEPAADETQVLGSSTKGDETRIIGSSPVASDATMVLSADTVAIAPSGSPRVISSGQEDEDATRTLGDIAGAGRLLWSRTGSVVSVALALPTGNPLLVAHVVSKCSMRDGVPRVVA